MSGRQRGMECGLCCEYLSRISRDRSDRMVCGVYVHRGDVVNPPSHKCYGGQGGETSAKRYKTTSCRKITGTVCRI